jgi:hypothetical protein
MLWQARAEINAPRHGRIEPRGKIHRHSVCGAAQPVGSERSPVLNRQQRPHSSHVRMSQAVVVPTFSYAGRDAARAHRRPDPNRHSARRFELAQTQTVWREPNSNRSQGVWRAQLANSEHSPAPTRQPPPRPSDDASSNGSWSRCKASCCHRGDAFERHMHVHTRAHTRAHRCARAGCERLGDASERSHLCSKSRSFAYGFASKRRAHLNGLDQSVHRRRACTGSGHTWRRPPSAPSLCAP